MNPFGYSKRQLTEIFSDVKTMFRDSLEEVVQPYVLRGLKVLFEDAMKAEVRGYLRAKDYERTDGCVDYRNGYRYRKALVKI